MALLQKQNLDVRLLGLDEKASPKTSVAGTITDGRNWQMVKDGRIEKRPGISVQAMLDTSGAAITGARELSSVGDELVMGNGKKWWARDAVTGAWIPRGRAAYERLQIFPAVARNAACNGVDSCLQMDSAVIGRTQLTYRVGLNADGTGSEYGWTLTDSTTGQIVFDSSVASGTYLGVHLDTDGHTSAPTFVAFLSTANGYIRAIVWDNTVGFRTNAGAQNVISDVMEATDPNAYGMQSKAFTTAPFSVQRVGDNAWLVAYQQASTGNIVVRRLTYSVGWSWLATSAATVRASAGSYAATIAWAYAPGADSATVAVSTSAIPQIFYATVSASTGGVSGAGGVVPASLDSSATCRGATGFVVGGQVYFLFDMAATGDRSVWYWLLGNADVSRMLRGCGLLTQAFTPALGDADEVGVGIAYPSPWQASSFVFRTQWSSGALQAMSIGAHLQAGDFAGRPMVQRLPKFDAGACLALGVLTSPASLGGPGTVSVSMATLPQDAHAAVSQPCEIANALLMPGAATKMYDGSHVTEAAFPLGPEQIAATEGTKGARVYLQADGTFAATPAKTLSTLALTLTTPAATLTTYDTVGPASVVTAAWPTGYPSISVRAWLSAPSTSAAQLTIGVFKKISSADGSLVDYNAAGTPTGYSAAQTITTTPTTYTITAGEVSTPVGAGAPNIGDRLRFTLGATGDPGVTMYIQIGGPNGAALDTLFPVSYPGTRAYVALAAWTDARGRLQRSQICQPTALNSNSGFVATLVVPTIAITERDPLTNLDAGIQPAQIEIYRTQSNSATFYRVATLANAVNGAALSYLDLSLDTDITANEQLYTTGGGVNHWPVIGSTLVAQHQGRVFVTTADNQVVFSAYAQSGEGLTFAAEYQVETEHIRNVITALLSLDDKLVICTSTAYAVLNGIGPEATGLPPYDSPMMVFAGIGPISQRACARTPTGVVMVTAHGAHLFDRGLNLEYVGIQVEADVPAGITWYTAAFHPQKNQVRLFGDSFATVYDWTLQGPPGRASQFFKWSYSVTVVACAISTAQLYYLGSDGNVYQADVGFSDAGSAYQEWIQLSVLSPTGQNAWGRVCAARFTCSIASGTTLNLLLTPEEGNLSVTDTMTLAGPLTNAIAKPRYGKGSSMIMKLSENAATTTAGITLDAIGLSVGTKGGLGRMPAGSKMVRS